MTKSCSDLNVILHHDSRGVPFLACQRYMRASTQGSHILGRKTRLALLT